MTYSSDLDSDRHRVGYYVAFDGIATRLGTHDFSEAGNGGLSGTFLPCMPIESISGGGLRLDRQNALVLPGGLSFSAMDTSDVRALIRRRGGTASNLTASLSLSATSLTLTSGTNTFADGDTVYIDRETITLGTHAGSGQYTGCTRGAQGSQAAYHQGAAVVSSLPRHWLGRRLQLFAVNRDTGTEKAIRTAILSMSPVWRNGLWSFESIDLMRELRRPVNTGWFPQSGSRLRRADTATTFRIRVPNASAFIDGATAAGSIRIDGGRLPGVYQLTSGDVDEANGWIDVRRGNLLRAFDPSDDPITVQQVAAFSGDPAAVALLLMLSDRGDGSNNATYDQLPGRVPTTDDGTTPARTGAALPTAWVDVATWESLRGVAPLIVVYMDEPRSLIDILVEDISPLLGGYVYVTSDGKISFQRWRSSVPLGALVDSGDVVDADKSNVSLDLQTVEDESQVISSAVWQVNYDPVEKVHLRRIRVTWSDQVPIYGDELAQLELSSRSIWVGGSADNALISPPFGNELQVVIKLDRIYARTRDGVRTVHLSVPWSLSENFVPGYLFALTSTRLIDHEGGTSQTSQQYEVTSAEPDYGAGTVRVVAEQVPKGYIVAPSAIVASIASTTITLDTTGEEANLFDVNPGRDFPEGATVRIYDASASPPFSVSETETISSVADDTITLGAAPGTFTVTAGDLVVLEYSADTGNTNAAGADVRDHVFMTDDAGNLDTSDDGTTWA